MKNNNLLNKKRDIPYIVALAAFAGFAVLIILLSCADVRVAPNGGKIGLGKMNITVSYALGYGETWYKISKILGYVVLAAAVFNVAVTVWQYFKRKKLIAVDREFLCLCGLYAAVAVVYVAFELFPVNFRPTSSGNNLEASFPSSHALLALTVCGSSAIVAFRKIGSRPWRIAAITAESVLAVALVASRTLSGVHWITDVIGSVILSVALVSCFVGGLCGIDADEKVRNKQNVRSDE